MFTKFSSLVCWRDLPSRCSLCFACSLPACKPQGSLTQGRRKEEDSRSESRNNPPDQQVEEGTPRWLWSGRKRQKLQEFSFFHHVSYKAFLYSPCLFFFMDSRTTNTIKELTRIYPLTALMCLHVLEKAAVQSVQAHVLSLNSRLLTVMVEDRIKSPKSLKWLKKWCLI